MLLTILFGIIGFGIIIFVHEFGHFAAAKLSGIDVEVFSLGWGKKLVGFDYRGTTYQISWFPVGGYCKMKGEESLREVMASKSDEIAHESGSFFAVTPVRRILVAIAGPFANLLFAIGVLTIIFWFGYRIHSDKNKIVLMSDYVTNSAAELPPATRAGLQTGDVVTGINGNPVEKFQDILEAVAVSPQEQLLFVVMRTGVTLQIPIVPDLDRDSGAGKIGGIQVGAHYSASKAAVICLTKTLALHAAEAGVTVNAVCPGVMATRMTYGISDEQITRYRKMIPLGRLGTAQDVAHSVLFLASEQAGYITGEIMDVNGGFIMD